MRFNSQYNGDTLADFWITAKNLPLYDSFHSDGDSDAPALNRLAKTAPAKIDPMEGIYTYVSQHQGIGREALKAIPASVLGVSKNGQKPFIDQLIAEGRLIYDKSGLYTTK